MKIYLRDRNEGMAEAWERVFKHDPEIHISCGDIFGDGEHMEAEAIVSPANSFGFMDGGIDMAYSQYFGWSIGELLRTHLWQNYGGELLVGQAVLIDMRKCETSIYTHHERIERMPYLISAPTMRVPANVSKTVNAYLAFKASLKVASEAGIDSILCPGLGTAIGMMPYGTCAVQMYEAYRHFQKPRFFDILSDPHRLHYAMLSEDTYVTSEAL